MDPVKVVIFVAAFIALLFLGRKLSSNDRANGVHASRMLLSRVMHKKPAPARRFSSETKLLGPDNLYQFRHGISTLL
jgi:hypothetical protein